MVGHRRRVLQAAAAFQIGGDPGSPKAVIADLRFNTCGQCSPAHHGMRIGLW